MNLFQKLRWDFFVFKEKLSVAVTYLAEHTARIACGNDVCRDIFCNDCACANNSIVSYLNSRDYDSSCAYPAVFSDTDRLVILVCLLAELRQYRMPCRRNGHIRPEHRIIAYVNMCIVDHRQIEIGVYVFSEMHVATAPV